MKIFFTTTLTFFLTTVLTLAFQTAKAETIYQINRDHSDLNFEIDYMVVSKVQGQFQDFQGQITLDESKKAMKNIHLEIEAASIFTNNKMRDNHLKKTEFLQVERFPTIVFTTPPEQMIPLASKRILGQLTLKGVRQPLEIHFKYLGERKDTWNHPNLFFEFEASILRSKFHLTWNKTLDQGQFLVGEKIVFRGHLQMQPVGAKTVSSRLMIPDTRSARLRERFSRQEIGEEQVKPKFDPTLKSVAMGPQKIPESRPLKTCAPTPPERSLTYTISLVVVGLFGFIGAILCGIYTRLLLLKTRYAKNITLVDILSISFTVIVTYVFTFAFYQLI